MTFDLDVLATIRGVKARKMGPKSARFPVLDVELGALMDAEILAHFHPSLRGLLFHDDGEPSFPQLEALRWSLGKLQLLVEIDTLRVTADLHRWRFQPAHMGPYSLHVGFVATFRTVGNEASTLHKLIGETVRVTVLPDAEEVTGNGTAMEKLQELGDALARRLQEHGVDSVTIAAADSVAYGNRG